MYKVVIFITLGILLSVGVIFYLSKNKSLSYTQKGSKMVEVLQKWELPKVLEEVSGIAMIDDIRLAAIQDEEGIIFIYNLQTSKIEKQVKFSGSGDYEGIAVVKETAYVLESDGTLYEIPDFQNATGKTRKHVSELKGKYNFEGLAYDKKNNRLLLAIKDEKNKDPIKSIYAFNLNSQKLDPDPAVSINLQDPIFDQLDQKKSHRLLKPSEIGINPVSGDYYILEGENSKLLIIDPEGNSKKLHILNQDQFRQAEGITFNSNGEVFISNEGKGGLGNIIKVSLN